MKGMKNMKDLMKKARAGDPDAFAELVLSYTQNLYRVAKAILMNDEDVADAIQEAILVSWEKLGALKEDGSFKAWVTRILIHKCYEIMRKNHRVIYMDELPEKAVEQENNLEWEEAMGTLDDKYRLILILYYAEGFRTKEIAKMLKIPDSTVRTRLARGREQLARYYERN